MEMENKIINAIKAGDSRQAAELMGAGAGCELL